MSSGTMSEGERGVGGDGVELLESRSEYKRMGFGVVGDEISLGEAVI
jgi:hypothetical protein